MMDKNLKTVRPGPGLVLLTRLFHLPFGFGSVAVAGSELQDVTT
ncbi:hypothetical protein [Sedimenticola hydrogenitrophicus]|nr:hypothetical protein [Sedimenticola hydrogenitrophicus]